MTSQTLKIGELASQTGSSVETIRYYEQQQLLPPPSRSAANYRLYNDTHVRRLQFIRHCRSLDMALDEIRTLLTFRDQPDADCAGVNAVLDHHIDHVAHRIKELKGLQQQLLELRSRCGRVQSTDACGILQELENGDGTEPRNLGSHSGGCH
ncbi:MAG: Cd(II)/Pb(II)-responsive transcriptional regulator [Oxalicibacterium faecigallinarum]|uniref:Cd(II)/Pb(II)-responsive transcriptional regulator n=1 Tax=Oxalicibacterium faecigallinarum TaxID=573741 RepID=UPI00280729A8|nr:Cd(II)/Pb(II)-responsive transcriptional regulator [Oxalicibacterium faecigallinarum]MDQ7968842.1 Cd(II)/Pb(II)-responsive transcriptional regulator [Oxalicibacterium faecigallinarum]